MALITLDRKKLKHNFEFLQKTFDRECIEWGVVTKLLCGNRVFLQELVTLGVKEMHDSRVSNLKTIKQIDPSVQTVYIKPPAKKSIRNIVKYADVSFNTELSTIKMISEEAGNQGKVHKIIIMIEMGDLREGVMGDELMDFYANVFELPHIEVAGIGTNLNCLYGVMPSQDKLIQLSLYEQLIEAKFNKKIKWVTGGSSVTIPLLLKKQLPKGINHFRVGEILYFGNNLFTGKQVRGMYGDVLKFSAQIIELTEKPRVPIGERAENPSGEQYEVNEADWGKTSYRAILDVGLLDISPDYLIPQDSKLKITGASSDMLVVDMGTTRRNYKVGDFLSFKLKYMGALGLLNSNYIEKKVE